MLSKIKDICEPETFAQFKKIFDTAWGEAEASGKIPPQEREEARTLIAIDMAQRARPDL